MLELVAHRGPDGSGTVFLSLDEDHPVSERRGDGSARVALGHRRLSILDLSVAGRQPMPFGDHLWITFNGEIYNYLELRHELIRRGRRFVSQTDTEVILAAYAEWGTGCFERFRGMWGLVLVDLEQHLVVLSRDRLGIKPLYLSRQGPLLVMVSELKQLSALPSVVLRPHGDAVARYLLSGFEDNTTSFYDNVLPVPAGTWQSICLDSGDLSHPVAYWHPERIRATVTSPDDAGKLFRAALDDSVAIHLRSDVPVGCALSGGLDSSAIAACATSPSRRSLKTLETFSVSFPGHPGDERGYADEMVKWIGASPHFVTPTPESFLADLDEFLWHQDEPVGLVSQYAAFALARLTREAGVPVSLNGQGGDEVLSGYWQSYMVHLWQLLAAREPFRLTGHLGGSVSRGGNPELVRQLPGMLRRYRARRWPGRDLVLRGDSSTISSDRGTVDRFRDMSRAEWRVYEIREHILPRLLRWDDRNFMAFSVESRYPLLDHVVVETGLSFTPEALYHRGWTKEPLRRGLSDILPPAVTRRTTKGAFETPQNQWLCHQLRPTIEQLVSGDSPAWEYLEPLGVRALAERVWDSGGRRKEAAEALFRVLMVDRWLTSRRGQRR